MESRPVAKVEALQPGGRCVVPVDGEDVALFNIEGRYFAIANRCPHRGGPLSRGHVEIVPAAEDRPTERSPAVPTIAVRCPIHGWLFDVRTGRCLNQPQAGTSAYAVTCRNGEICLQR